MKRIVFALALCAVACGEAPKKPEPVAPPPQTSQATAPQLKVTAEAVTTEEWIDAAVPIDLKTENGTKIPKGNYLVCPVKRMDGGSMAVDRILVGTTPGKTEFTIPISGYTVLPSSVTTSTAALRGSAGKATLWVRIAGTNGEWGSAIFDVDPQWSAQ